MSPEALFVLLGAIASVAAVAMAYVAFRYSAKKDKNLDGVAAIQDMIEKQMSPIGVALGKADTRMAVLETKVDMLWVNLQKDMAKGIHSPDPRRAHIDYLMDKIIQEEPMSQAEIDETKRILHTMIEYEAGHSPDPGFPIKDGDQVFAAFLLRSFDVVPIPIRGKS